MLTKYLTRLRDRFLLALQTATHGVQQSVFSDRVLRAALGSAFLAVTSLSQASAQTVIRNDLGGSIEARLQMIANLRNVGERVEIRGVCASSCTMLLGLPTTCVAPNARLHFHGPSTQFYGVALAPKEFERWSRIMAEHYPPAIRQWFMSTARHTIMGTIAISGNEAARLGARACA
jgi:ATP-dependent protease ClpP protease subunit